jgi:hypothetical protein
LKDTHNNKNYRVKGLIVDDDVNRAGFVQQLVFVGRVFSRAS